MSRFIPIQEVVKSLCLQEGDLLQRKKGRYLSYAKEVWMDMELQVVKDTQRQFFSINKRTNSINLPCDYTDLSGISVVDHCGVFHPIYRNERVKSDIVDIGAKKNCACECGGDLCNLIKGYEAVVEDVEELMPDASTGTFTKISRKAYDKSGFYYEENTFPVRVYESGIWTDTALTTERKELCRVEVADNGCITDCPENYEKVCTCTGTWDKFCTTKDSLPEGSYLFRCEGKFDLFYTESGKCFSQYDKWGCFKNIYNISEEGNRLVFPANFGWDKVLVRFFRDINLRDLQIPRMSLQAFKSGLKWWDTQFKDKIPQYLKDNYERHYSKQKFADFLELNKYRIAEIRQMFTPHIYVP
jgi:hypothetical protein